MKQVKFEGKVWDVVEQGTRQQYEAPAGFPILLGGGMIITDGTVKVYVLDWDVEECNERSEEV